VAAPDVTTERCAQIADSARLILGGGYAPYINQMRQFRALKPDGYIPHRG
jgi:hypothetical protein